ncbi:MAG: threonine/serine exporter family protein [Ezakiella sp.]|nr:threonine/serine exporter family protein [Ezakiella sp.]MDD7471845.1 threonine/serine exporter family protein [Bacillota bacterium]MDY3923809.1 threonine/serine exporter family protein [Ezakiella sp.]
MVENWLLVIILSFLAGAGFCLLFQVNKKHIFLASICSATSWTLFQYLTSVGMNSVFSTFVSGFIVGIMTEIFAKIKKCPAINFIIIGTIPLVPGLKVYQGTLKLIEGNTFPGISQILEAVFIAIAIAISILVSTSIFKGIRDKKFRRSIKFKNPNAPN